jgi:SAM-dependent MidA family methyltransferase
MNLTDYIINHIHQHGDMPFVEYMQQALYHPQMGYYSAGLTKFGPKGDFVTAPELTPLFGYTLAQQFKPILKAVDNPQVLEFGAGSGRLCIDVLTRLEQLDALPDEYFILEVSPNLRHRQQEAIQQDIPHLACRVKWLSEWPSMPLTGVVIANEVLDAMPVHRFIRGERALLECVISVNDNGELVEQYTPCNDDRLLTYVEANVAKDLAPYQSEVNLFIDGWLEQCSNILGKGAMFIIDYGFPRHEFYHPDRRTGTLMCHYQHQAHSNPLAHPGEEDITAHVDFTHVAEAGVDAGFEVLGYTNQGSFLLANGILEVLTEIDDEVERVKQNQAVKQLIQENEMGELFKVMALTKSLDFSLNGFMLNDKRYSL